MLSGPNALDTNVPESPGEPAPAYARLMAGFFCALLLLAACGGAVPAAPSSSSQKAQASAPPAAKTSIKAGYSTAGAGVSPLWVAKDSGLFVKHGLDAELLYLAGGGKVLQTLVSGGIDFGIGAGAEVVLASATGGKVKLIGSFSDVVTLSLFSQPSIKSLDQLRGKEIAVTQVGTVGDYGVRYVLEHNGLKPDKDVGIVQFSGGQPEILAAVQGGKVAAGIFSTPGIFQARAAGLNELVDLTAEGIPYVSGGIGATDATLSQRPDVVRAFMQAMSEAVAFGMANAEPTKKILASYMKTDDQSILDQTYDVFWKHAMKQDLAITDAALKTIVDSAAKTDPRVATLPQSAYYDPSIAREVGKSGTQSSR